jgi:hypothetical protein
VVARFVYLQVVRYDYYLTRAEDNRISLVPIAPNRGLITRPQRRRAGAQLLGLHAGDHALQGGRPGCHHRRAVHADRHPAQGPQALQEAARREPRASNPCPSARACRTRRWRASSPSATAFPGSSIKARLFRHYPFGEFRGPRARLHRPHQRPRSNASRRRGFGQLSRHRPHRQDRPRKKLRGGAPRHHRLRADGGRLRRPRRAHAARTPPGVGQQSAPHARPASCRRSPKRPSATAAAPWWRSSPPPAACSPWSPRRASTRTCSSMASTPRTGIELNTSPGQAPGQPRAQQRMYPPGSTFKPFMALAGLELGKRTPTYRPSPIRATSTSAGTASATTRSAAMAWSTCTSPSSSRATPTTTCSLTIWASTRLPASWPPRLWCPHRHRHRRRGHRRAALAGLEEKALQEARAAEVVRRRNHLDRHRPGLQRLYPDPAGPGDGDAGQQRRDVPPPHRQAISSTRKTGEKRTIEPEPLRTISASSRSTSMSSSAPWSA